MFHSFIYGQEPFEKLKDKAFDFYFNNKNIDSALFYYKTIQQIYPDFRPSYINNIIGSCYLAKQETELAKKHLILSLQNPEPLDLFPERVCITIGDIFLSANDYRNALAYYDSSTSYYRTKVARMSRHKFKEGNLETIYKKSICFDKLNRIDTAISILTPYVFISNEDDIIDSSEIENIVDYYISLLKRKYTNKQIKMEFTKAMKGLFFEQELDSSLFKGNSDWKLVRVECFFIFFGKQVNVFKGEGGMRNFDDIALSGWRKEDILNKFYKTAAYKKLIKL